MVALRLEAELAAMKGGSGADRRSRRRGRRRSTSSFAESLGSLNDDSLGFSRSSAPLSSSSSSSSSPSLSDSELEQRRRKEPK